MIKLDEDNRYTVEHVPCCGQILKRPVIVLLSIIFVVACGITFY